MPKFQFEWIDALKAFAIISAEVANSRMDQIDLFSHHLELFNKECFNLNHPNFIIERICKEKGLDFIDLTPYLKNHPFQPVYFTHPWHWNKEGQKLVSGVLSERIYHLIQIENEN